MFRYKKTSIETGLLHNGLLPTAIKQFQYASSSPQFHFSEPYFPFQYRLADCWCVTACSKQLIIPKLCLSIFANLAAVIAR